MTYYKPYQLSYHYSITYLSNLSYFIESNTRQDRNNNDNNKKLLSLFFLEFSGFLTLSYVSYFHFKQSQD
jgi:hypothetical protein